MVSRPKYLFIRLLEACNAGCFMCGYANSRDRFRFERAQLDELLPQAADINVRYVRFTGGEPLLHRDIVGLVEGATANGMETSIITNGMLLPKMAEGLAAAGLKQVVVSIDGSSASTHDEYRKLRGCFDRALEGLARARSLGIRTRVNTVVGPHNYQQMPELKAILTTLSVDHWELSALKLPGSKSRYPDISDVLRIGEIIYEPPKPIPMGKKWYGDDPHEQTRFFEFGLPPRPSGPVCHVADDVLYVDGRNGEVTCCSCISHHPKVTEFAAPLYAESGDMLLASPPLARQRQYFKVMG
ncbi:MAG TPA: radical SAM protein, partial [Chloroflexota bacterium]|nr:radical SAM protein [Chloroflexota bacterium]